VKRRVLWKRAVYSMKTTTLLALQEYIDLQSDAGPQASLVPKESLILKTNSQESAVTTVGNEGRK